jgi:hypothetical protein
MSMLSGIVKKVSDKVADALPDDSRIALTQLSHGNLAGVKQVR